MRFHRARTLIVSAILAARRPCSRPCMTVLADGGGGPIPHRTSGASPRSATERPALQCDNPEDVRRPGPGGAGSSVVDVAPVGRPISSTGPESAGPLGDGPVGLARPASSPSGDQRPGDIDQLVRPIERPCVEEHAHGLLARRPSRPRSDRMARCRARSGGGGSARAGTTCRSAARSIPSRATMTRRSSGTSPSRCRAGRDEGFCPGQRAACRSAPALAGRPSSGARAVRQSLPPRGGRIRGPSVGRRAS